MRQRKQSLVVRTKRQPAPPVPERSGAEPMDVQRFLERLKVRAFLFLVRDNAPGATPPHLLEDVDGLMFRSLLRNDDPLVSQWLQGLASDPGRWLRPGA